MAISGKVKFKGSLNSGEIKSIEVSENGMIYFATDSRDIYLGDGIGSPEKYTGSIIAKSRPTYPISNKIYLIGISGSYNIEIYINGEWEVLSDNSDKFSFDSVIGMQIDDTLDPVLIDGSRYIILDSANLNTNFGLIVGLEDNDIVEYKNNKFVVIFDASLTLVSVTVTVTTDSDGNTNELWFYNTIDDEWQNSKIKLNYWTKTDDNLHYTSGKVSVGYGGSSPYGTFNVKGDVYIGRNNDGGTNESYYFYLYSQGSATNRNYRSRMFSSSGDGALPSNSGFILQNQYWNGTSYDYYTTISSYHNKVGINMSSPSYNLDVSGTFRATGNINLGGITYTPPTADGVNDYVLTTNGSGVLSWSQKTGGTSGTITSINGSSEAAQTITSGTGLTVIDSGIGNYIHTISVTSGYVIPTTTDETNWNSALTHSLLTSGNPHSVTHDSTSPSAAASGITYGHINTTTQKMYGSKQWVGDKTIGRNNEGFTNETYYLYLKSQGGASNRGYNARILAVDGEGIQPADSGIGIDVQYWNGTSYAYKRVLSAYDTGLVSLASLKLTSVPSTDASSSPVLVRDASTGEIKQTTLTAASNNYVTSASFSLGTLTLERLGLSDLTATGIGTVTLIQTSGAIVGGDITGSGTISHSGSPGYIHIPSGGATSQILQYAGASGTAQWYTPPWTANTGTVTSVTAGNGMTQTGTSTVNPTLNIVSHAGTSGSIGTINIGSDAIGVNLGTSGTVAAAGNHNHSGVYDNYSSWTAIVSGLSSEAVTSGSSFTFVGGSGITLAHPTTRTIGFAVDWTAANPNTIIESFSSESISGTYNWILGSKPNIKDTTLGTGTVTINVSSASDGMSGMLDFRTNASTPTTIAFSTTIAGCTSHYDSGVNLGLELDTEYFVTVVRAGTKVKFNMAKYV